MKSLAMKFAAIVLAALCLLTAVGSTLGIVAVSTWEMDAASAQQIWKREFVSHARDYAYQEARRWATASMSTAAPEVVEELTGPYLSAISYDLLAAGMALHSYTIRLDGQEVASGGTNAPAGVQCWSYSFADITPTYNQVHDQIMGSALPGGKLLRAEAYDGVVYHIFSCQDLCFQVDVVLYQTGNFTLWSILQWLWQIRDTLPFVLACSVLLLAVSLVYLCWAAGKKKGREEIRPGGLNRLPLDLYGVLDSILGYFGMMLLAGGVRSLLYEAMPRLALVVAVAIGLAMSLLIVGYVFCFAAQVKVKGFWWRHSVIGFCLLMIFRAVQFCWRGVKAVVRLLPVMWQWLLTAGVMALAVLVSALGAMSSYYPLSNYWAIVWCFSIMGCAVVVVYGGYCFGSILKATREMAAGNLAHRVNTKYMIGAFRDCGNNINALSSAATVAAEKQMKSERMKTELITNVSHDIKTPLTSIINYVDLLQKPHSEEEGVQYLEVLQRQSHRLKKLTEDLVELSKASSGNVTADLKTVDAGETVLQALGEFGDKLDAVPLSIVFRQPEEPVWMIADGRLCWRVLSNILSNAVKYGQPGTRLYVDLRCEDGQVMLTFKNISRESLNLSAEELMERFVRGDASRNSDGSGLGLNIARSLMQVQGGDLTLTVDGDLFKVTLTFQAA